MLLRRAWGPLALSLIFSLSTTGCIVVIDPVGTDASLAGSWTVDGLAPTEASCAALGIGFVEAVVRDGGSTFSLETTPCAAGGFDTRPSRVLADGTWSISLRALDGSRNPIPGATGPERTYDTIASGGHVVLQPVDFEGDGPRPTRLAGSWTINGGPATVASCSSLGIVDIEIDLDTGPVESITVPCEEGSFVQDLAPGTYEATVFAVDAAGEVLAMGMSETFNLPEGTTFTLNSGAPIDFVGEGFDPRGMDAGLSIAWDIGGNPANEEVCDAVLGHTMEIVFYDELDTGRDNGVVVHASPCDEGAYASGGNILRAGRYLVSYFLLAEDDSIISFVDDSDVYEITSGNVDLGLVDFRLDSDTVHIFLEWEIPSALGTFGTCAEAGVAQMYWELDRGADAVADSGGDVPCLEFVNVMGDFDAGDYSLYIEDDTKDFEATCGPATHDGLPGALVTTTCRVEYVP